MREMTLEVKSIYGQTKTVRHYNHNSDMTKLADALLGNSFMEFTLMVNKAEFYRLKEFAMRGSGYKSQTGPIRELDAIYNEIEEFGHIRFNMIVDNKPKEYGA